MQPTAKPKPAPKLRPRHSIQDLHSSPRATASSAPHPLAAQPRSAEHAPTLATGAPVGVHTLTHPLWPPPPFNQPAQPAPILARGGLPVTQPSPLFPWFAEHGHPLPRPQPRSICQAPKPHSALRHEPSAAPLSPGPLDLGSRAQPERAVAPRFRQAKLGPHAQSQATQREKCIQDWQDLLAQIGSCSITFVAAAASQDPYAAFEASLRAYTPSTIAQYFRCIRAFLAFIRALGFGVQNLLLVHLVDLLHACENSKLEDRSSVRIAPPPMLKALSWLARIGQIESLASSLQPTCKSLRFPSAASGERRLCLCPWQFWLPGSVKFVQPTARITCASRWAHFSWRPTPACVLETCSASKLKRSVSLRTVQFLRGTHHMLYMLSILRPAMGSVAELTRSHDCTLRPIDVLEVRHQEDCTVNVEVLAYCKETLTKCGVSLSEMIGLPFTREEVEVRQPLDFAPVNPAEFATSLR